MVRAVSRVLEVHDGGPVVGEVLGHFASGARSPGADVTFHGRVESITTNNVVDVGRGTVAGLDDGVKSLNSQGRAPETKASVDWRDERESDGEGLHLGGELSGSGREVQKQTK